MKEYIDTIPINDAFSSGDECPFCYLERLAEQKTIRYVLGPGASYMEPDVRAQTDRSGFCGHHFKMMYDYGNALGSALILQTYYAGLLEELEKEIQSFQLPPKKPLLGHRKAQEEPITQWARGRQNSCFVCSRMRYHMNRYGDAFFAMLKEPEFRSRVEHSKGFCMRHFGFLMDQAGEKLPNAQREWFYPAVLGLMKENLSRVKGDIDWFVGMFDYRQAGADWKNSRDAVPRGMQKLQGLHPSDPPYKMEP